MTMTNTIKLIAADAYAASSAGLNFLQISNDTDVSGLKLQGIASIELQFPKFTDGRAYSQAYLLRRRLGFKGDLRATGDVLVDQVLPLQRSGFSSAVLRADQNMTSAQQQLSHFAQFYQGAAMQPQPHFAQQGATA